MGLTKVETKVDVIATMNARDIGAPLKAEAAPGKWSNPRRRHHQPLGS
jgi:hypothetical protein